MSLTVEQKAYAFDLQSKLGMTVENKKFHACAQIGHPYYGYVRYRDCHGDESAALYNAIIECAESYYSKHPEERPNV